MILLTIEFETTSAKLKYRKDIPMLKKKQREFNLIAIVKD